MYVVKTNTKKEAIERSQGNPKTLDISVDISFRIVSTGWAGYNHYYLELVDQPWWTPKAEFVGQLCYTRFLSTNHKNSFLDGIRYHINPAYDLERRHRIPDEYDIRACKYYRGVSSFPSRGRIEVIQNHMIHCMDRFLSMSVRLSEKLLLPDVDYYHIATKDFSRPLHIPANFTPDQFFSESIKECRRKVFENETDFRNNNYESVRNRAARIIQNAWQEARLNPYTELGRRKINRDYDLFLQ